MAVWQHTTPPIPAGGKVRPRWLFRWSFYGLFYHNAIDIEFCGLSSANGLYDRWEEVGGDFQENYGRVRYDRAVESQAPPNTEKEAGTVAGLWDVHLLGVENLVNILWDETGIITRIEPAASGGTPPAASLWEAKAASDLETKMDWRGAGCLVLPPLVDIHTHLDKTGTIEEVTGHDPTLEGAGQAYGALTGAFLPEQVYRRALRAAQQCAEYGTSVLRTHIDSCYPDRARLAGVLAALMAVRQEMADRLSIELVLMCPTVEDSIWAESLCTVAPQLTALGGAPHLSKNPGDNVRWILKQARRYGLALDLHVDETLDPSVNTLEILADEVNAQQFPFPVVAGHVVSLLTKSVQEQRRIAKKAADRGIHIVSLPQTNCYLQGRKGRKGRSSYGQGLRGTTPFALWESLGVPVAIASDNMQDPFHPWGNGDLLQVAALALYAAHLQKPDSTRVLQGISSVPGQIALGSDYGIAPGHSADFVALQAHSAHQALAQLPEGRAVFHNGRRVLLRTLRREWTL